MGFMKSRLLLASALAMMAADSNWREPEIRPTNTQKPRRPRPSADELAKMSERQREIAEWNRRVEDEREAKKLAKLRRQRGA